MQEVLEMWVPEATYANTYGVPDEVWDEWGMLSRRTFNHVYGAMSENQRAFIHPVAGIETLPQWWHTTAYNAAFFAARSVGL